MNILVVGDGSNFHVALGDALQSMGHKVVIISEGCRWLNTRRDIDITRQKGKIGAIKYGARLLSLLPMMRGWDAVYVHTPTFLHLRPLKVKFFFDYIRRHNKMVVYSMLNTDYYYVKKCLDYSTYRYSDFRIGSSPSPHAIKYPMEEKVWTSNSMRILADDVVASCDVIIPCLWEYYKVYEDMVPQKLRYGGIPIDTRNIKKNIIENEPQKVRFMLGYHNDRMDIKGTDKILEALKRVVERNRDKAEMVLVSNVPYSEYLERLYGSHVLLDQLYSYTPSTNALLGMARGMVAVSGAEPEYYDFIGERDNHPIINISPLIEGDIEDKLEWIIKNKSLLPELSRRSAEFVSKHNDSFVVAKRHLNAISEFGGMCGM